MQTQQNDVSVTFGSTNAVYTPTQPAKTFNLRENPLKIDESIFYYLTHTYMNNLYTNDSKERNDKGYELENFGEILGRNINERVSVDLLEKLVKDKEKQDIKNLEYIKFLCKEFWIYVFGKAIDRLQTNHKGTFFLTDSNFKFLSRINGKKDEAKAYLNFAMKFVKALIKGALIAFSLDSEITMESSNDIEYSFVIKVKES